MPELPEVETIKRDLEHFLTGRSIVELRIPDPTIITGFHPRGGPRRKVSVQDFDRNIAGKRIRSFRRRGKYIAMEFSDGTALIFHLRMTGQLMVRDPLGDERLVLSLSGGLHLCFVDRRRFGEVLYSKDWKKEKEISQLGVEPLNGDFSPALLKKLFRGRKSPIHSLLLNQKIVCGLGNIYVTESLFQAGILPFRAAGKVSGDRLQGLATSIREVLSKSIANRGYSMNTYVDAMGAKGRHQLFTLVYGKEGNPCAFCKNPLRKKVLSGRGVVYCRKCQK